MSHRAQCRREPHAEPGRSRNTWRDAEPDRILIDRTQDKISQYVSRRVEMNDTFGPRLEKVRQTTADYKIAVFRFG